AMLLGALVAFGRLRDPGAALGRRLWSRIVPLGRRLLPIATLPRAFAFGMLWGWMPCGFVYTVLLLATLQSDALRGAMTLAAFGVGTAPALLTAALSTQRFASMPASSTARHVAGYALLASAALTFSGPWLVQTLPALHAWLPLDCR